MLASLSVSAKRELAELLEERHRRECRKSFLAFCTEALEPANQIPAAHHRLLIKELEAVAAGHCDRLMIFMPPNSAKTTYASMLFPPWFVAKAKNQHIIGSSHGAKYAEDLSKQVIRFINNNEDVLGYKLLNEAADLWRTSNGATYRAAGAGGSITGRRADLFLIDDPIKGRKDANSAVIRDTVWNWYRAEVLTRLNPGCRILLIQTRWHEDDLAGRLLAEMANGADQWRIVNLPAVAEENDAMGRQPGEALWPERFPIELLNRTRAAVGEQEWAALYQQRPRPLEGALFKVAKIVPLDVEPNTAAPEPLPAWHGPFPDTRPQVATPPRPVAIRSWDLAATAQVGSRDPDWTVGLKMMREASGRFIVLDVVRLRGDPDEVEAAIVNTAKQDGTGVAIRLAEDPGQAGKAQSLYFVRKLAGYRVETERETGDKATRAAPVASQCNGGNLAMVKAPWNSAFREELAGFPNATHDDQVDALSGAFNALTAAPPPTRSIRTSHMDR